MGNRQGTLQQLHVAVEGQAGNVEAFVLRPDGSVKLVGGGSVCEAFGLDPSTLKICGVHVPYGHSGFSECDIRRLRSPASSTTQPWLVSGFRWHGGGERGSMGGGSPIT